MFYGLGMKILKHLKKQSATGKALLPCQGYHILDNLVNSDTIINPSTLLKRLKVVIIGLTRNKEGIT